MDRTHEAGRGGPRFTFSSESRTVVKARPMIAPGLPPVEAMGYPRDAPRPAQRQKQTERQHMASREHMIDHQQDR